MGDRVGSLPPGGYLLISAAVRRLSRGMWGGINRPVALDEVRRLPEVGKRAKVGFGPWRERAAERFRAAACGGELPIYAWPEPSRDDPAVDSCPRPIPVPLEVLKSLRPLRGGLPHGIDQLNHSLIRQRVLCQSLFARLLASKLCVSASEFADWYSRERERGLWPSQRERKRPRRGRPRSYESIKDPIQAHANAGSWNTEMGIPALQKMLVAEGRSVPSHDTLTRIIDELFDETGLEALNRRRGGTESLDWLFKEGGDEGVPWREQTAPAKRRTRRGWRQRRRKTTKSAK